MVITLKKQKSAAQTHKMNSMLKHLNRNKFICVIILLYLIVALMLVLNYKIVWWDSAVYIGMGKYIFSSGQSGLWEESRPLTLPFILGMWWKLGFNPVYLGRLISIMSAAFVIIITYKIGVKLFSKKLGLLAAFFTAFSFTFLFFSPNILTEIPATLFMLLAFYSFLNKKYFFMGLFSGIAIMTRFFQVFALIGLWLAFFFSTYKKPEFGKKLFYSALGILILILPYLLLNFYLYNDMLLPFKVQAHLTKTTGWMNYREFGFYFTGLFKENFFLIFLLALPFYFKKNYKFYALVLIPLIYILIFFSAKHKEMRFILAVLPFLYLLLAYCLEQIYNKLYDKKFGIAFFYVMIALWIFSTSIEFKGVLSNQEEDKELLYFQDYLTKNIGSVWITSPLYALHSNQKIDGLLYFYSSPNLIDFVNSNKYNVDTVLFNYCDIECPQLELDPLCPKSRKVLKSALSDLRVVYQKEVNLCKYEIYKRAIS